MGGFVSRSVDVGGGRDVRVEVARFRDDDREVDGVSSGVDEVGAGAISAVVRVDAYRSMSCLRRARDRDVVIEMVEVEDLSTSYVGRFSPNPLNSIFSMP